MRPDSSIGCLPNAFRKQGHGRRFTLHKQSVRLMCLLMVGLLCWHCSSSDDPPPPVDDPTPMPTPTGKSVFAINEQGGDVLYLADENLENRQQITIGPIEVAPEHALGDGLDLVHENQIIQMGVPGFSPDGSRIVLEVSMAFDQSQLIVLNEDGSGARTASPQTQIVAAADWAPGGGALVYLMSKGFGFSDLGVFVTDLVTDEVRELPIGVDISAEARIRWNDSGDGIYFVEKDREGTLWVFDLNTESVSEVISLTGVIRDVWRAQSHILLEQTFSPAGPSSLLLVGPGTLATLQASTTRLFGHFTNQSSRLLVFETNGNGNTVFFVSVDDNQMVTQERVNHGDFRIDVFPPAP